MTQEEKDHLKRSSQVDAWLQRHGAEKVGDRVFDNVAIVVLIAKSRRDGGYEIRIVPNDISHDIGQGCGMMVTINCNY